MNFLTWALGLFLVYLLLTGQLVQFIQFATQSAVSGAGSSSQGTQTVAPTTAPAPPTQAAPTG